MEIQDKLKRKTTSLIAKEGVTVYKTVDNEYFIKFEDDALPKDLVIGIEFDQAKALRTALDILMDL
jgi:hypothetical protein